MGVWPTRDGHVPEQTTGPADLVGDRRGICWPRHSSTGRNFPPSAARSPEPLTWLSVRRQEHEEQRAWHCVRWSGSGGSLIHVTMPWPLSAQTGRASRRVPSRLARAFTAYVELASLCVVPDRLPPNPARSVCVTCAWSSPAFATRRGGSLRPIAWLAVEPYLRQEQTSDETDRDRGALTPLFRQARAYGRAAQTGERSRSRRPDATDRHVQGAADFGTGRWRIGRKHP